MRLFPVDWAALGHMHHDRIGHRNKAATDASLTVSICLSISKFQLPRASVEALSANQYRNPAIFGKGGGS